MLMFVSTHEAEINRIEQERRNLSSQLFYINSKYDKLLDQWNELVGKINAKGGDKFLNSINEENRFSQDEIKKLIALCHPDKHQQKQSAVEMTQKLLAMRN